MPVPTPEAWIDDFRFLLRLELHLPFTGAQQARLKDYLSMRYSPYSAEMAFSSLKSCYNWLAKNWVYLHQAGIIGTDDTVPEFLIETLQEVAFRCPAPLVHFLPFADPSKIVRLALKHAEAE